MCWWFLQVRIRSTDVDRILMSVESQLSAFFIPGKLQVQPFSPHLEHCKQEVKSKNYYHSDHIMLQFHLCGDCGGCFYFLLFASSVPKQKSYDDTVESHMTKICILLLLCISCVCVCACVQMFNDSLPWQPIPIHTTPTIKDTVSYWSYEKWSKCSHYQSWQQ